MKVLIAGSSGFLGTALSDALVAAGHGVTALVRRPSSGPAESTWDPYADRLDPAAIEAADVVINLAGSPTLGNPHSAKWARELRESRVRTTEVLAAAIASSERKPAFLAGNGISYYGDHGDEVLTEDSDSRGEALLTVVTREWQSAADPAVEAGARVCILRTSPVMDARSAPLKQLRTLFRLGLGGRLGDGSQFMPMISLRDWTGAVVHLAEHDDAAGPFNLICPEPPTNAAFTAELAKALNRPSFATAPRVALKLGAGKMAPELLGSINARPAALEAAGFAFSDRNVAEVLRTGLNAAD
ncbi:TIGR01777 family oxidoreductase [Nocardioides sp.]|uniref:TIGR01777 family oxidoreductase n=1 Tax=Nocardioides sp. TaxID=35761 RepID=UPI0035673115